MPAAELLHSCAHGEKLFAKPPHGYLPGKTRDFPESIHSVLDVFKRNLRIAVALKLGFIMRTGQSGFDSLDHRAAGRPKMTL